MVNQMRLSYGGMNQDVTKSKHPGEFYFNAKNIRILNTDSQSSYSITNELGNSLEITIPALTIDLDDNVIRYGTSELAYLQFTELPEIEAQVTSGRLPISSNSQTIIGFTVIRNGIVLFTTDDNGFDCVWEVKEVLEGTSQLELLYCRDMGFSTEYPIQAIFNYENENIQKVYWIDGVHQIRNLNIRYSQIEGNDPLINLPLSTLNSVGIVNFSQPVVNDYVSGGTHTAGRIQYAYNLYRLNSSQTKISPLSELYSLDKGVNLGGGALNEIVGISPIIQINDIDTTYTNIRVYAIKYTSYNEIPSISLIEDKILDGQENVTIYDDGNIISTLSLEEFLFLGSEPTIAKHIESKDNRLILANIKTKEFVLNVDLDCRAYSHSSGGSVVVYENIFLSGNIVDGTPYIVNTATYYLDEEHDAVNIRPDIYKYTAGGDFGGTGKYIEYEIVQKNESELSKDVNEYTFLKDRELYRIGIEFINGLGQKSQPKWIADFRVPEGNLRGRYNTLEVRLKDEFYVWLNTTEFESEADKPIGYNILRADRTQNDRSIICQGLTSAMMFGVTTGQDSPQIDLSTRKVKSLTAIKRPNILMRTFNKILPLQPNVHLRSMMFADNDASSTSVETGAFNPYTELQHDGHSGCESRRKSDNFQYDKMLQLYSPEVMFENVNLNSSMKYRVVGGAKLTENSFWGRNVNRTSKQVSTEGKVHGHLSPHINSADNQSITGDINNLLDRGLISDVNGDDPDVLMQFSQFYRKYTSFIPALTLNPHNIYRSAEITEKGKGNSFYGNDPQFSYNNNFIGLLTDGVHARCDGDGFDEMGNVDRAIINVNSEGAKCITFIDDDGLNDSASDPHLRRGLNDLYNETGIDDKNVSLISEIIIPESLVYVGNLYGGNSYEDKKRTSYIKIGNYNNIETSVSEIDNAGDTYVQNFKFERVSKSETDTYAIGNAQFTEIVEVTVETTVDLKNRNDISINEWDSEFQPEYVDFHEYNRVYSQQPTLVQSIGTDANFQRIKEFDTRIQASKLKTPNEEIDSWTDLLVNEIIDLNGKYGPINGLVSFKDNIFSLQDEAIASIAINPRVQVQGSDGVSLELGSGGILYDYNYITTKSGSINKWSTVTSNSAIYYYDALNRSWNRFTGQALENLSDKYGLHAFFLNNINYQDIKRDNPILRSGVVSGHSSITNEVFLTVLQKNKESFNICFNEMTNSFTSFYDYLPSFYIIKGFKMITTNPNNNQLWEHFKGNYNEFYGLKYDSVLTLMVNPQERDNVFNNIEYKSEFYLNEVDQPKQTLTHIKARNEYLSTIETPLVLNSNLNRKFRMWRANIPRATNVSGGPSLDRMRGHWIHLDLIYRPRDNYKMILHDVNINYTPYN